MKFLFGAFIFFSFFNAVFATEIHVSVYGDDNHTGTIDRPLRTIQAAVDRMKPGDSCIVHNGTYRETVKINKTGEAGRPLSILAAKGENPVISGLDVLRVSWKPTDQKGVFVAEYSDNFSEQVFMNGKPLIEARWPNVPRDKKGDWDFFSPDTWASVDTFGNRYGTIKDEHLSAIDFDINGAKAVLNVCHQFFTWTRIVSGFTPKGDTFNYPKDLGKSIKAKDESGASLAFNDDRYYLVGKKEFLDAPGEWYFDAEQQKLYVYSIDGYTPKANSIEVKKRYFSMLADENTNYLAIEGITFWASAFKFGKDIRKRNHHVVFKNNQVFYSSSTDFFDMLPNKSIAPLDQNFPNMNTDFATVANNLFAYGTLNALSVNGRYALIENNLFHDFDYHSSLKSPLLEVNKNIAAYVDKGGNATVRYNTLYNSGGILAQIAQNDNDVYLNELHDAFKACWGGNKDVCALYTQNLFCHGTRFHHNWVHECYVGNPNLEWGGGMGIRGDDLTCGLTVDHNVVWNTGSVGIMVKNYPNPTPEQANKIMNNTIFRHSKVNPVKSAIILSTDNKLKKLEAEDTINGAGTKQNEFSIVTNNLAETIYGGWFAEKLGKVADDSHNLQGKTVESLLFNAMYSDFRPVLLAVDVVDQGKEMDGYTSKKVGKAPDIGAYEFGDSVYWIPGRREVKASFPIVADGAKVAIERDVLMWRPAYQAIGHNLYFGTSKENLKLSGAFLGENNVFNLPKLLAAKKYFWRVDAVMKDMSVIKGDVWSFSTH